MRLSFALRLAAFSLPRALALLAGDPPAAPILRLETGMNLACITRINVDVSGQWGRQRQR